MRHNATYFLTFLLFLGLSTGLCPGSEPSPTLPNEEHSTIQDAIDTTICCLHWIVCPYCLTDPERQINRFQTALDNNDTKAITHIIRRRGLSPNQPLNSPDLPIICASRKAHAESVEQLLKLGADVNSQLKGNQIQDYPSSLIAVCSTKGLPPERVTQTVKILLEHGADPSRSCIMLTTDESEEFSKLREKFAKDPSQANERRISLQIPQFWFKARTALHFANQHSYTQAAQMIRQALENQQKKGNSHDQTNDDSTDNL